MPIRQEYKFAVENKTCVSMYVLIYDSTALAIYKYIATHLHKNSYIYSIYYLKAAIVHKTRMDKSTHTYIQTHTHTRYALV